MARSHREGSIAALVMLDGAQATALVVVIPFTIFGNSFATAGWALGAVPIATGFALGMLGTLLVGRMADSRPAIGLLQSLQIAQAVLVAGVMVSAVARHLVALSLFTVLALAVSRSVGPAKDKIRSEFIGEERRTLFNAQVRRYFLVVNEIVGAVCTVTISILPPRLWPLLLVISLICIAASLVVASSLRPKMTLRTSPSTDVPEQLSASSRRRLGIGLVVVGVGSLTAALPGVGLSAWIAAAPAYGPWLVTVVGLSALAVDFFFIRLIGSTLAKRPSLWPAVHRLGGALVICATVGTAAALGVTSGAAQIALFLFAMICASLAYSVSAMLAMEIQFGFGSRATRGRIASYTRLSAAGGLAVSSWLAPGVFLGGWVPVAALASVGLLLCLLPRRLTSAWTSLARSTHG